MLQTSYNQSNYHGRFVELMPCDNRKSFYGKALAEDCGHYLVLYSYNTPVAKIDAGGSVMRLWSGYSLTTMRHFNAFLRYAGHCIGGKKVWEYMEINRWYPYEELLEMYRGGKK